MYKSWCVALLLLVLVATTACQVTQSGFGRTAQAIGADFAAASVTLDYAHTGKITKLYAQASFQNYQEELSGMDQQLTSQQGGPGKATIEYLLKLYRAGIEVVNRPCLEESCNWHAQVAILDRASQAFLKVGGQ